MTKHKDRIEKIEGWRKQLDIVSRNSADLQSEISTLLEKENNFREELLKIPETNTVKIGKLKAEISNVQQEIISLQNRFNNNEALLRNIKLEYDKLKVGVVDNLAIGAKRKIEAIQPLVEDVKPLVKDLGDIASSTIKSGQTVLKDKINKDKKRIQDKVEKLKETPAAKKAEEHLNTLKDDVKGLNAYRIIGQGKRNIDEAKEDLNLLMEELAVKEKLKASYDKFVPEKTKLKFASLLHKVKVVLDDAAEAIEASSLSDEDKAKELRAERNLKKMIDKYIGYWLKTRNVQVTKEAKVSIIALQEDYITFMESEYSQNRTSKLVLTDIQEFVLACEREVDLPLVFDKTTGLINLEIK